MQQVIMGIVAVLWIVLWLSPAALAQKQAAQKETIQMGPYVQTLKQGDTIEASIARGQEVFNSLGCAGCHPRGGTIGGVANDVTGNRMNIPIPDLHGAALHYPRIAGPGFIATIGTLNDL
jgi:hypothetical protein